MKKFIKNNIKVIIAVIISGVVFTTVGVYAASQILAKDISFTPKNENWEVDNLEDAINDLYNNSDSNIKINVTHIYTELKQSVNYTHTFEEDGIYAVGVLNGSYSKTVSITTDSEVLLNDYYVPGNRISAFEILDAKAGDTVTLKGTNYAQVTNAYIYKIENFDFDETFRREFGYDATATIKYTAEKDEEILCFFASNGQKRSSSISFNNNSEYHYKSVKNNDSGAYILKMKSGTTVTMNAYGNEWGAGVLYFFVKS